MTASHLFPRMGCEGLPVACRGDGICIYDADGRRYLDGSSGAAASCLGHSNEAVAAAIKRQVDDLAYAHTSFFTSEAAERLAEMLVRAAPDNINRVYFVSGGSEAMEAAIKLARQYHVANGEAERGHVIARLHSYHGNTLGALAVGGNRGRRELFAPLLFAGAHHIPPCHYWRWAEAGEDAAAYGHRAADALEEKILEIGAEHVAAFVAETVVGATLGAVPAVAGYFKRIREICDRYGVLLILDEVMCGTGRTGSLFACEQEGIAGDIICMAKGIGAAMQPLGVMLCDEKIYTAVTEKHGGFQHGHTYMGHITACAAGVAVLEEMERHDLLTNVRARGEQLRQLLNARFAEHPNVGDIRGRGLFLGLEFVKSGKTPFAAAEKIHRQVHHATLAEGLMVYAAGGSADGRDGDHILIAPPFIIDEDQVAELTDKLTAALGQVFN